MEVKQPTLEALKLLVEVSQLLSVRDLDRVLQQVIDLAAKAVGASKASLFLHDNDQIDWDHILIARDLSPDESVAVVRKVLNDGFAGWVLRNKRGDIIYDTQEDARWHIFPDDKLPVRSAMCVPFLSNDHVIAVLTLVHPTPGHFTEYHLRLMTVVVNQFAIAIRNAQFFHRIQSQQRQLQTILQAISDVLIVLDAQGRIMLLNEAAVPLLGVEFQGDAIGRFLSDFVVTEPIIQHILEALQASSDKDVWSLEVRSERRKQDFQARISLWRDILDGMGGYVLVLHDVTTLRDLNRFKDEMLRVASHDLRSPLALISGYVDMIEWDMPQDNQPVREHIDVIKRTLDRMGGLLDDLLRVERIRSSPLELNEQVDLQQLMKVVIVNMRPAAVARQQTFEAEIALEGVPRITADPVLLRQSIENLIGNAIKYTPEGGVITIRAGYDAQRFYFSVRDTGVGIAPEHLNRVFEPFFRVTTVANVVKGSGLGLSLVKNVIERHGGEISVTSALGEGSTFSFWLPLS